MLFIKVETYLIVVMLVQYFVNFGSRKFVEWLVILKLYNELKLESMSIQVTPMGHIQLPTTIVHFCWRHNEFPSFVRYVFVKAKYIFIVVKIY
jgi:hypothetical protein